MELHSEMAKRSPPAAPPAPSAQAVPAVQKTPEPDRDLQRTFGRNLRIRRQAAGLTQTAVADAANMRSPDISRIEAGRGNVTLDTMQRLARAVLCRVEVLLLPIEGD